MNRRGFLAGIIAAAVAPAIIRTSGLIMPIKPALVTRLPFEWGVIENVRFIEEPGTFTLAHLQRVKTLLERNRAQHPVDGFYVFMSPGIA